MDEESQTRMSAYALDSSPAKGGVRITEGTLHGFSTDSPDGGTETPTRMGARLGKN
jgi:hypothetical protein